MIGEIWVQNKSLLETQKTISDLRNCSIFDLEVATELVNACKLKLFSKVASHDRFGPQNCCIFLLSGLWLLLINFNRCIIATNDP